MERFVQDPKNTFLRNCPKNCNPKSTFTKPLWPDGDVKGWCMFMELDITATMVRWYEPVSYESQSENQMFEIVDIKPSFYSVCNKSKNFLSEHLENLSWGLWGLSKLVAWPKDTSGRKELKTLKIIKSLSSSDLLIWRAHIPQWDFFSFVLKLVTETWHLHYADQRLINDQPST